MVERARWRGRRRAAEHPDRERASAAAQLAGSPRHRRPRAREGSREAAAGAPDRAQRRHPGADRSRRGAREREAGLAALVRRARRVAHRAVVPARALARRIGRDQLPALLRREPARRAADGRSGGVRRGTPLRVRARRSRRRDGAPHRSCGRPVRAGRLPAPPAADARDPVEPVLHRRREDSRRRRAAAARVARRWDDRLRVRIGREQPLRGPAERARVRRHLSPVRARSARAADVRRAGLPQQETGAPRNDVGRHQFARPPVEPLLGTEPSLPRLHALQPDLDDQGNHRVLPGLPDVRDRSRSGERARQPVHRRSDRVREAARRECRPVVARVRVHQASAPEAHRRRDARGMRGARALHRKVPADHQSGRGEGDRGYRAVRVQPAAVAERRRQRSHGVRSRSGRRSPVDDRAAAVLAGGALGDVDARHQARRGRSRAPERAVGNSWRVEGGGVEVADAEPAAPHGHRRRARARSQRGVPHLPDARRHVADRRRSIDRLRHEGAARVEGAHELVEPG